MKKKNQPATPASQPIPPPKTASSLVVSTKVNVIQSTKYSGRKNKGKNKSKKSDNQ